MSGFILLYGAFDLGQIKIVVSFKSDNFKDQTKFFISVDDVHFFQIISQS